jgi:acyl-CoA synthetase (AMP-forming)/AMP-acid ligase II
MLSVCDMQDWDRVFKALPLFHSFGLAVGTLLPMIRGLYVSFYPSPLHYRVVPTMFYHRDCTIMLGTNTFLNGYARKAHPMDFRSLRYMSPERKRSRKPPSTLGRVNSACAFSKATARPNAARASASTPRCC